MTDFTRLERHVTRLERHGQSHKFCNAKDPGRGVFVDLTRSYSAALPSPGGRGQTRGERKAGTHG